MTYKQALIKAMLELAGNKRVRFLGYNTTCGPRMNGTLNKIPKSKCIEMPVAENLIMGLAMGMSLEGYRPVVCIERMDFLLVCADAIINHLDKLPKLSGGQFDFPVIIRTCVGHDKPLDPGMQHVQDFTSLFARYTSISVRVLGDVKSIVPTYRAAMNHESPSIIVEHRQLYDKRR